MLKDVTLTGKRAQLVPLNRAHTDDLFQAGDHPDIWTDLPVPVRTYADMQKTVEAALQEKEKGLQLPFTVIDRVRNKVIGSTRFLNISEANRNLEIGWTWYSPEVWQTEVNTECKYLLLTYCFETLGCVRVQFKADVRNERSNRAILRIGAMHEGILRKDRIFSSGYIRNANLYSILDDEWNDVKLRFEHHLLAARK